MRARPVIAIDGPAGSGKSTAARLLADRLGFVLVDTGALYRGSRWRPRSAGCPGTTGSGWGSSPRGWT
jgi:cytidylate kinase